MTSTHLSEHLANATMSQKSVDKCTLPCLDNRGTLPRSHSLTVEIQTSNWGPTPTEEFGLLGCQRFGWHHEVSLGVLGHKSGLRGRRKTRRAQTSYFEVTPTTHILTSANAWFIRSLAEWQTDYYLGIELLYILKTNAMPWKMFVRH